MAGRKAFLLRVDPTVLAAIERWAADELRSANSQIEYLLRQALLAAGRLKAASEQGGDGGQATRRGRAARNLTLALSGRCRNCS